jgi:hypothetical protein
LWLPAEADGTVTTRLRLSVLGQLVAVRVPGRLGHLLAEVLVDLCEPTPRPVDHPATEVVVRRRWSSGYDVLVDGEFRAEDRDAANTLVCVLDVLSDLASEHAAVTDTVLHGGVLQIDGRAIALVGVSGAGKTTLTAAGVRAGHGFVADEVCAVAPDGLVRPFHRPLGLRPHGATALGIAVSRRRFERLAQPRAASTFGRLAGPSPLAQVALVQRGPAASRLEPLEPARALVELCNLTLGAEGAERTMFHRLAALVRSVPIGVLSVDEALPPAAALHLLRRAG